MKRIEFVRGEFNKDLTYAEMAPDEGSAVLRLEEAAKKRKISKRLDEISRRASELMRKFERRKKVAERTADKAERVLRKNAMAQVIGIPSDEFYSWTTGSPSATKAKRR